MYTGQLRKEENLDLIYGWAIIFMGYIKYTGRDISFPSLGEF